MKINGIASLKTVISYYAHAHPDTWFINGTLGCAYSSSQCFVDWAGTEAEERELRHSFVAQTYTDVWHPLQTDHHWIGYIISSLASSMTTARYHLAVSCSLCLRGTGRPQPDFDYDNINMEIRVCICVHIYQNSICCGVCRSKRRYSSSIDSYYI